MAEIATWLIAVIAIATVLLLIICGCILWRCCCKHNGKRTFEWIERLGIPFAREGKPKEGSHPKNTQYRVRVEIPIGRDNSNFDAKDEKGSAFHAFTPVSQVSYLSPEDDGTDGSTPFKRLDQLGIPRARRENTLERGGKAPSSPLPNPDSDSSDDEENVEK